MAKKFESKDYDYKEGKESIDVIDDGKYDEGERIPPPKVNVIAIEINPSSIEPISEQLELRISFDLDRDCVASYWVVKFLVDSSNSRIIRVYLLIFIKF